MSYAEFQQLLIDNENLLTIVIFSFSALVLFSIVVIAAKKKAYEKGLVEGRKVACESILASESAAIEAERPVMLKHTFTGTNYLEGQDDSRYADAPPIKKKTVRRKRAAKKKTAKKQ